VAVSEHRILLVENDPQLRSRVERGLADGGFDVTSVPDGATALQRADLRPALLVIDVDLPDTDGRDLRLALQALGCAPPVLFLTTPDAVPDRMPGFRPGGDDYVTKPFQLEELLARTRALLRWAQADAPNGHDLRLDPVAHAVTDGTNEVPLTPTEFRLLSTLTAHRGSVVRRRDLVAAAWPEGAIVYDNTLDQYVARLRRKLRAIPTDAQITTVRGVGYRLG
jgi:two-component system response regulator MprA